MVLLHGLGGSSEEFEPVLDDLASRGWHAIALDLRGHGASPRPPDEDDYRIHELATDVLHAATEWDLLDFVLFGHEAGGVVAQEVALRAGPRIQGLILQSTCPGPLPVDRNLAEGAIELVRGTRSMRPLEQVEQRTLDCAPAAYASIFTQLLDAPDRSLRLAELHLPALAVAGGDDDVFLEPTCDLAAVIPAADLEVVAGGRQPHLDRPDAWADLVGGFLAASRV